MKLDCFETSCVASVNNYLSCAALFSTLRRVLVAIECFGLNCKNATKFCLAEEVFAKHYKQLAHINIKIILPYICNITVYHNLQNQHLTQSFHTVSSSLQPRSLLTLGRLSRMNIASPIRQGRHSRGGWGG